MDVRDADTRARPATASARPFASPAIAAGMVDLAPGLLTLFDARTHHLEVRATEGWPYDIDVDDYLGRTAAEVLPPVEALVVEECVAKALASGDVVTTRLAVERDGHLRRFDVRYTAVDRDRVLALTIPIDAGPIDAGPIDAGPIDAGRAGGAPPQSPLALDVALPVGRGAIPVARALVAAAVRAAGLDLDRDALLVVVSELVTNAVMHAQTALRLALRVEGDRARVEVSDGGAPGAARPRPPTTRGGYGLHLVTALTEEWGVDRRADGKTVWAEVAIRGARVR